MGSCVKVWAGTGIVPKASCSPIHEQEHPSGEKRRHRDEIGDLKRDVLPEENARKKRASNRQLLDLEHRVGDELKVLRV